MSSRKKVLVCPLDWGLGHATRCIPIIRQLLAEDAEVLIAADGAPLALLKEEFPKLTFITLPGYNIRYSRRLPMALSMLLQSPKILLNILREHKKLGRMIDEHQIDLVIADNRYGLWNTKVHAVFIIHQLYIKCPPGLGFMEPLLYSINHFFINRFNACWIPDAAGSDNLSGALAHGKALPGNATFIGWLSRFDESKLNSIKKYDLLCIVSGPEPHRSLLLEQVLDQLKKINVTVLVIAGEPQKKYDRMLSDTVRLVSHLKADEMEQAIQQSQLVVCRAGYSGIMDLVALKKNALLIPTPGQTEQEYLAKYLQQKGVFYSVAQDELNLEKALGEVNRYGNFSGLHAERGYATKIKKLMEALKKS